MTRHSDIDNQVGNSRQFFNKKLEIYDYCPKDYFCRQVNGINKKFMRPIFVNYVIMIDRYKP